MEKQFKERTEILSVNDVIEAKVYNNDLAYGQACAIINVFAELKAVRNVCAEVFNSGPVEGEISPKMSAELVVKWLDRSLDDLEKIHKRAINS